MFSDIKSGYKSGKYSADEVIDLVSDMHGTVPVHEVYKDMLAKGDITDERYRQLMGKRTDFLRAQLRKAASGKANSGMARSGQPGRYAGPPEPDLTWDDPWDSPQF